MKKILVTYATMAGSTAEVAQAVGEEIGALRHRSCREQRRHADAGRQAQGAGASVDVLPLEQVRELAGYDGVVLGGPMIVGWHRAALGFLRRNRRALREIPLAIFVTALSLTSTDDKAVDGVPVYLDEKLPKPPARPGRLSLRERYALLPNYVRPILRAARPAQPASVGVFGGRMEYGRLKPWAVMFVMLAIQAPAGDRRNWPAVRAWAREVGRELGAG